MPYDSKEELLKLGEMDPELAALLEELKPPPMDYSSLGPFREAVAQRNAGAMEALGPPGPGLKVSEVHYTTADGTKMRAKLFQPEPLPKDGAPLVVMYHGGGFCLGTPESEEQSCRSIVQALGAVCLSASYRLAPEWKFPYSITDAWDALRWAAANAGSFGADPSKGFVIGGTSAGGNITAVLAHLARDEGLSPPLTGEYLAIPAVCPNDRFPEKYKHLLYSYEQNAMAPVLPQAAIDMFMENYAPDHDDAVRFAVLNHPKGHHDLPPAYFQICGQDPLRDEALVYEKVLREEFGVKTKVDVYPGLPHGFWSFFPKLKSSDKFRKDMIQGMGWLLGKTPKLQEADTDAKIGG